MRNHTLMQTIARANRVFPGKNNGLIVDYANVFASLEKALAIYGKGKDGVAPLRDKALLVEQLRKALRDALQFCDNHGVTGGAPVDIANLTDANINWTDRVLQFYRQKITDPANPPPPACVQIGPELEKILRACPSTGLLFPTMHRIEDKHRSAEFRRRCRTVKLTGLKLYSYRYAWAERAQTCGYPERFAMSNLGHSSKAVTRAYSKKARVVCPSLEQVESDFQNKKIVSFKAEEAA
jgi:integrase